MTVAVAVAIEEASKVRRDAGTRLVAFPKKLRKNFNKKLDTSRFFLWRVFFCKPKIASGKAFFKDNFPRVLLYVGFCGIICKVKHFWRTI